jgi:hypothetical protein
MYQTKTLVIIAGAGMAVLLAVALRIGSDWFLLAIGVLAFLVFVAFFLGSYVFANKHPSLALLEGAELLMWHREVGAAKNLPAPPASELPTFDPAKPVPKTIDVPLADEIEEPASEQKSLPAGRDRDPVPTSNAEEPVPVSAGGATTTRKS